MCAGVKLQIGGRQAGKHFKQYSNYPLGTKAHATGGGCWIKVERGWKWATSGCVFPTPGADVIRIELPDDQVTT